LGLGNFVKDRVLGKEYPTAPQNCEFEMHSCGTCKLMHEEMAPCIAKAIKKNNGDFIVRRRMK